MNQFPALQSPRLPAAIHHPAEGRQTPTQVDFRFFEPEVPSPVNRGVQVHDFEQQLQENRARARAAALQRQDLAVNLEDVEDALPLPDLHRHAIHIPTRTSSNRPMRAGQEVGTTSPGSNERSSASNSGSSSVATYDTRATSILPPLQVKGVLEDDRLAPLVDDDPACFDLVAAPEPVAKPYSLEHRSGQLFSREHLEIIFEDPALLLRFTSYMSTCRPKSIPMLIYYLDAVKALKAISYANAIAESLEPIPAHDFTATPARPTVNSVLEEKAKQAFEVLVREDLPAYITHIYTHVVSLSVTKRITGTLSSSLREASEGLAEVFCLTDPTRPDNPIIFASEEFHRTTQYGMSYAIGRNCRFLQGPRTNPFSVSRFREAVEKGREHCEVFLNYRRDGSPFMNLLMIAPLCDSRGQIRYHIGAQVDVSGIVKECTDLESLRRLVNRENGERGVQAGLDATHDGEPAAEGEAKKDEFQELSEMFNLQELDTVRRWGGRMHKDMREDETDPSGTSNWHRPRLLLSEPSPEVPQHNRILGTRFGGKLSGVYQNYLLVRPYPSLRILFASPSLRVPGLLQSPFMQKIGGSARVREELSQALVDGRGVTAKVRWVSKIDDEGRNRWIHCTPLIGSNGQVGVWMVIIVDDEKEGVRRWRQAPPVPISVGRPSTAAEPQQDHQERRDLPVPAESAPRPRSPGQVRTYNQPISLDSNLSLELDPPVSGMDFRRERSPFTVARGSPRAGYV